MGKLVVAVVGYNINLENCSVMIDEKEDEGDKVQMRYEYLSFNH